MTPTPSNCPVFHGAEDAQEKNPGKNIFDPDNNNNEETTEGWRPSTVDFHTLVVTETTRPGLTPSCRPIAVPIVNSVIFEEVVTEPGLDKEPVPEWIYGRDGNPTRNTLEQALAKLEGVKHAVTFGSGTGSAAGVLDTLEAGDGVVAMYNIYGGCLQLLKNVRRLGVDVQFLHEFTPETVTKAIKENTKMVWLESPGNPNMKVVDIEEICRAAHNVKPDVLVVVDNTFLTPIFQRPIELGADVCIYSLTKYIGGHNDIIMGAVTTDNEDFHKKVRANQLERGGVPSPFDCYLAIRSLKTLPLRMQAHFGSCLKIAKFLQGHPHVLRVRHPGLKSHESYELARRQQCGHSGVMSFYIRGGYTEASIFLSSTQIIKRAASLGGDASIGCLPMKATHNMLPAAEREELGITENFIRLSIGLESPDVLIKDIDQALNKACANL